MKRIAAVLVLFLWSGLSFAGWLPRLAGTYAGTSYYINSATGSNSNNGLTPGAAWLSIAHLNAATLNANSTVFLSGTFTDGMVLTTSVVSGNIKVTSYGSSPATITSGNSAACVTATNVPSVVVNGIVCTGGGNGSNTTAGISIVNSQAGNTKLAGPTVTNNTISGYGGNGIEVSGTSGHSGFNGLTISGNTVHDVTGTSTNSFGTAGIYVFSQPDYGSGQTTPAHTNVSICGNTVYNATGITSGPTNWTGSGIVVSQAQFATIGGSAGCGNVTHNNGGNSTKSPGDQWTYDSDTVIISYGESYNGGGTQFNAFDLDGGITNSILEHNWAHNNIGTDYLANPYSDGTCCTVWGNNTIRFNIGQNASVRELEVAPATNTTGPLYVYNNSFANFLGVPVIDKSNTGTLTWYLFNNELIGSGGTLIKAVSSAGTVTIANNDYYTYGQALSISWLGTTYTTVAAWGLDSAPLTSNPNIYVPGGGFTNNGYVPSNLMAYNLQSGSAMIGAGLNPTTTYSINPGSTDYYGVAITASAMPVGAANGDFATFTSSCTPASSFLARVSSFTKADNVNYNSLLCGMSSDGDLALIDALYLLAAPNSSAAVLNLISTSYTITPTNAPTFSARNGYTGNGTNNYLDTGFTGNSGSPNFSQNSATLAVYDLTAVGTGHDYAVIGNSAPSGMYNDISLNGNTPNGAFLAVNEGGGGNGWNLQQPNAYTTGNKGYFLAQRTAAAVATGYFNGVAGGGTTEASASIATSTNMFLLAGSFNPTGSYAPVQISAAMIGGGTISALRTSLRFNSAMMANGINVY